MTTVISCPLYEERDRDTLLHYRKTDRDYLERQLYRALELGPATIPELIDRIGRRDFVMIEYEYCPLCDLHHESARSARIVNAPYQSSALYRVLRKWEDKSRVARAKLDGAQAQLWWWVNGRSQDSRAA